MAEITTSEIREYLLKKQGREVNLNGIRSDLNIVKGSKSWDAIRNILYQLEVSRVVRQSGKRDGVYKVVTQVKPVSVFGKERRPPISVNFPCDSETRMPMPWEEDIVMREGDLILIAGQSNYGKTTLAMNIAGENIDSNPVLMGNEYTTVDGEPTPRFLNRIDAMDWVKWYDEDGDRFTLLPVRDDYVEHIVKDRMNIIDWINIPDELYLISRLSEDMKRAVGKGVIVAVIQKSSGSSSGRGGQFTKDFTDLEILLDPLPESSVDEVLLTLGKIKESRARVMGRSFAYGIRNGVKIINLREVYKCKACFGKGWRYQKPCTECNRSGYIE